MHVSGWESEAKFRSVFDHAGVPMALTTLEGRFIMANQAALKYIGYTEQELYRLTIRDITHPSDRHLMQAALAQQLPKLLAGQIASYQIERRYMRKDGATVWGRSTISAVRNESSQPIYLVGVMEDITRLKEAEDAIRRSEARFRATFEQAAVGMAQVGLEGRWLKVNQRLCDIIGYDSADLLRLRFQDITHPDDLEADLHQVSRLMHGEIDCYAMEKRYIRRDGSIVWVNLTVSLVRTGSGEPDYFIAVVEDIGRRKKAEDEMRRAEEEARRAQSIAEAANTSKDQFLAVLSHELRTPLTPALAMVSMLESDPSLPAAAREDIVMVRRNIETEARLIDDLLDVTRIARGKIQLHFEAVDMRAVLRAVMDTCRSQIDSRKLEVRLALRSDQHHVWGDPGRIQQVFMNLLQNAIKFTPVNGRIEMRTIGMGDRLQVEVSDSGIGIDPRRLPHIFNAFEQGERTIVRRYGGLGLGLTISKSLVEMHGGTIGVSSAGLGRGATFEVQLPLIDAELRTSVAAAPSGARGSGRVLLVEDHPDTLRVMARMVRELGFEVVTAGTVHEALVAAEREQIDLLVSDIGLPDGSGTEIMRAMKGRAWIKGIAISGFGMEEDIRRSRDAGFVEHLTKPINMQMLGDVLRRIGYGQESGCRR